MRRLAALFVLLPLPVVAQNPQPRPPACTSDAHRAFDYWVGEWSVHDTAGTKIAESSIERVAEGCAISETWRPIGGQEGVSISWYDPGDQQWHQQWVGGGGWIAWFDGNPDNGNMTLTTKPNPAQPGALSRMIYTQPRAGVVLQTLYGSSDGGKTWTASFKGEYRRKN
jgi:hypothetical protein